MSSRNLKKILIVGGGTAGWMAAAVLLVSGAKKYQIELIESDEISTVGVGEATIPSILTFNTALGVNEDEFMRQTQATFKLGIQFRNWGAKGDSYIHSFGTMGRDMPLVDFYHYWLKMHQAGKVGRLADYCINLLACEQNKFANQTAAFITPIKRKIRTTLARYGKPPEVPSPDCGASLLGCRPPPSASRPVQIRSVRLSFESGLGKVRSNSSHRRKEWRVVSS